MAPRLVRRLTRRRAPAGRGEMEVTGLSAPTVTVFISSSLNSFRSEKRYSRSLTIAEFKVWPWGGAGGGGAAGQRRNGGAAGSLGGARSEPRLQRLGPGPQRGGARRNRRFRRRGRRTWENERFQRAGARAEWAGPAMTSRVLK